MTYILALRVSTKIYLEIFTEIVTRTNIYYSSCTGGDEYTRAQATNAAPVVLDKMVQFFTK